MRHHELDGHQDIEHIRNLREIASQEGFSLKLVTGYSALS